MVAAGLTMMRSLVLLLLALTAASPISPAPVTIDELIAHPSDHYDQRLIVSGILKFNSDGPLICELPSRAATAGHDSCIDIATANAPIGRFDWSKRGALITITGYFSHTCPKPDTADEDGVHVMCLHRGWRGFVNVEALTIGGYATCEGDDCAPEDASGSREVASTDAEAQGIADFAQALASAARSRRPERIVAITLPALRTETRFNLTAAGSFDRDYGEIARAPAWIAEPGKGFRLFLIDRTDYTPSHHQLCFCVKGDCASHWPEATADRYANRYQCRIVWRDGGTWYLLY